MNGGLRQTLLGPDDPPPVRILNPEARGRFLLIGDHAGNLIPAALGTLGLDKAERSRHIGWDIGIGGLGPMLADRLDAVLIRQTYSRLVIDCNRDPAAPDAIAPVSDGTPVPGNANLSQIDREARVTAIHEPYHRAIADELARRGDDTILVALHSFTPRMAGHDRPWQIGILHDAGDPAFARTLLAALQARTDLTVGDNQPYAMDGIDYTVPRHAYPRQLCYAEIEIRQDLLADEDGQEGWADLLAETLGALAS